MSRLRTWLTGAGRHDGPPVCAVYGPPGIGKTSLAVHAAHEVRSAFPDGQLYVDLHGADSARTPGTLEVLAGFVRALGPEMARLPDSVAECDLVNAEKSCGQAITIFREIGDRLCEAYGVQALTKVHIRQGRCEDGQKSLGIALTVFQDLRDRFGEALTLRTLGELHLAEGALDAAARQLSAALPRWDELGLPLFRARTQRDLARLHHRRGDHAAADAALVEALDVFHRLQSREYAEILGSAAFNLDLA